MTDYQQLLRLMQARRSIRKFSDQAVSRDDLLRLIEAARWAPSNHNRQPWRFLIVRDPSRLRALAEGVGAELTNRMQSLPAVAAGYAAELKHYATFFDRAPVLICVWHKLPASVSAPLLAGMDHPALVSGEPLSVAMAVQNLMLAAHALGLGTCVMTGPLLAPRALASILGAPPGFALNCFVAVGHPAESPEPPRRKSLEQIVEWTDTPLTAT